MTLWRLTDGKRGHENQTAGLCDALLPLRPDLQVFDLSCQGPWWRQIRLKAAQLPSPDLVLAAGHRTHLPLLLAKRLFGGRTVVLMKPTLPIRLFDLAFIPRHDLTSIYPDHVIPTLGMINRVQPSSPAKEALGVVLVGGSSKLFDWTEDVSVQIRQAIKKQPDLEWIVTDSRRTPASGREALRSLAGTAEFVPVEDTDEDWVPRQLARARSVWVTEDSVSMVFEALTSGASVGILSMPCRNPHHRVAREIKRLEADGMVTRLAPNTVPAPPPVQLWEADRCARLLLERFRL